MKDSSIAGEVLHLGIFVIVLAVVVLAGWNEPLRYLLMKPHEIAAEEAALFPTAAPSPVSSWRPGGTALDRSPWIENPDGPGVIYTDNIDGQKMGSRTEAETRRNLYGPGPYSRGGKR